MSYELEHRPIIFRTISIWNVPTYITKYTKKTIYIYIYIYQHICKCIQVGDVAAGWAGPGGAGRGRGRGGAGRAGPARRGGPAAAKYFVYMFLYMLVYSGYIWISFWYIPVGIFRTHNGNILSRTMMIQYEVSKRTHKQANIYKNNLTLLFLTICLSMPSCCCYFQLSAPRTVLNGPSALFCSAMAQAPSRNNCTLLKLQARLSM